MDGIQQIGFSGTIFPADGGNALGKPELGSSIIPELHKGYGGDPEHEGKTGG